MITCVGTGRCGTATFIHVFNTFAELRHVDQVRAWKRLYGSDGCRVPSQIERFESVKKHLELACPDGNLKDFANGSWYYFDVIDVLYKIDPTLKVLFLVRNAFDFCMSAVTRQFHLRTGYPWEPNNRHHHKGQPINWIDWNSVQRAAWIWQFRNNIVMDLIGELPLGVCMSVATEKFYDCVDSISTFIGRPYNRDFVEKRKIFNTSDWCGNQTDCGVLDIAGETIERLKSFGIKWE